MKRKILDRYDRTADRRVIIDIAAGKVAHLYNDFDKMAPYVKKELDQDLVDYLVESMEEIGRLEVVIRFSFNERIDTSLKERVQASIHNYFVYLRELEIRALGRMGRTSLLLLGVGLAILFLSVWVNDNVVIRESVVKKVFAEGLIVAAWVSLWEALANFLINWAPHHRHIRIYERLARAPVQFYGQDD